MKEIKRINSVTNGIVGFVMSILGAVVYNIRAGWIKIKLKDDTITTT